MIDLHNRKIMINKLMSSIEIKKNTNSLNIRNYKLCITIINNYHVYGINT